MLCYVSLFWMCRTEGTSAFAVFIFGSRNCSCFPFTRWGWLFSCFLYMKSCASVDIRGPKLAAVRCMGSGFAPGSETKVNSGFVSTVEDAVLGGVGFFRFWKGLFPIAGGKGLF